MLEDCISNFDHSSSSTLQAVNQISTIRSKIEANLMVGLIKYVRVEFETAANVCNDIKMAILRTAHGLVDPEVASDLLQQLPESLKILHQQVRNSV